MFEEKMKFQRNREVFLEIDSDMILMLVLYLPFIYSFPTSPFGLYGVFPGPGELAGISTRVKNPFSSQDLHSYLNFRLSGCLDDAYCKRIAFGIPTA